jgi:hypothetical protein
MTLTMFGERRVAGDGQHEQNQQNTLTKQPESHENGYPSG